MDLTLQDFPVLENLGFGISEAGVNDADLAGLLDSILSLRFSALVLDVSAREKRCAKGGSAQNQLFFGEMRALDFPLFRLATRTFQGTGRRPTLILLANNPTAVVRSLVEFQKVGNTWKGERVIGSDGRDIYWSLTAARDCEGQIPDDSVLNFISV